MHTGIENLAYVDNYADKRQSLADDGLAGGFIVVAINVYCTSPGQLSVQLRDVGETWC